MRKKGFIAISFLTGIILALIILSTLFVYFFTTKEKIQEGYENIEGARNEGFERLLASGTSRVIFPYSEYKLKKSESNTFPIGIRNIFDRKAEFVITVEPGWSFSSLKQVISSNGKEILQLPIKVPGDIDDGMYKLIITVECDLSGKLAKLCRPYYKTELNIIVN